MLPLSSNLSFLCSIFAATLLVTLVAVKSTDGPHDHMKALYARLPITHEHTVSPQVLAVFCNSCILVTTHSRTKSCPVSTYRGPV